MKPYFTLHLDARELREMIRTFQESPRSNEMHVRLYERLISFDHAVEKDEKK